MVSNPEAHGDARAGTQPSGIKRNGSVTTERALPPLRLAADRRSLMDAVGRPFFYLADTAWAVVWKGRPSEWSTYLERRAAQGFSVVQVNLLPWRWELTDVDGNRPFHGGDPDRPNDAYFARFETFLKLAAAHGIFTCLMLIWGGPRPTLPAVHFTTVQATAFARYAVRRFGRFPALWSLSGDAEYSQELAKWEAVGQAVEEADTFGHPKTNHLPPSMNWRFLHAASPWHDFHMLQTGHRRRSVGDIAALPLAYYHRQPVKAVVNGEPWYERHPARDTREYGPPFTAADARYAFWVSVLNGATMGHTYGAQGIWNWKRSGDDETELAGPQIGPIWSEALGYEGAAQVGRGAALLRTLPWWRLAPCPERVRLEPAPTDVDHRAACARVADDLFLAYLPRAAGHPLVKGLEPAADWMAHWFDPRTGERHAISDVAIGQDGIWRAPAVPGTDDWVLLVQRA